MFAVAAAAALTGCAGKVPQQRKQAKGRFLEAEYLDVSAKNGNFEP